jgi:DNA adenine methylase
MVQRNLSFIISYDGRTGDRSFGRPLPPSLGLTHIEIHAGPSSQATLLGRSEHTVESLYLSSALVMRLRRSPPSIVHSSVTTLPLLEVAG